MGRGASSLTPALSFQVTDSHALDPGLVSHSEVNISQLLLPEAPPWGFFSESGSGLTRLFGKLVTARTRALGNPKGKL